MRLNYIDNCDCLEGMKRIPNGSVDLIVTDPPYLCDYSRHATSTVKQKGTQNGKAHV